MARYSDPFSGGIIDDEEETFRETPPREIIQTDQRQLEYGGATGLSPLSRTMAGTKRATEIVSPYIGPGLSVPLKGVQKMTETALGSRIYQPLSDKIVQDVISRGRPYDTGIGYETERAPVRPTTRATPPAQPTGLERWFEGDITTENLPGGGRRYTTSEGVMTAGPEEFVTGAHGRVSKDELARQGIFRTADETRRGIVSELEGEERLRTEGIQRQRGDEAYANLEMERALGIVPPTGMAEYEASAGRMREEARLGGLLKGLPPKERAGVVSDFLKGQTESEKTRVGAVSEREKAGITSQYLTSKEAMKSQAEAARLGIAAEDVKSKIQLRRTQMDDLATKTGLLEPMKLKLAQAKDAREANKIRRDTYTKAIQTVFDANRKEFERVHLPGMPLDEAGQKQYNDMVKNYQAQIGELQRLFPEEGETIRHGNEVAIYRNGKWVPQSGIIGE
jgi:hypothetical protein